MFLLSFTTSGRLKGGLTYFKEFSTFKYQNLLTLLLNNNSLRLLAIVAILATSCTSNDAAKENATTSAAPPRFTLLPPEQTHVQFSNNLTEALNTNILMYEYFYNGGGVAAGDLNGDGLADLYFTGNMTSNQLYLNKGQFAFDDITLAAGVAGRPGPWKTGITMADVNGDGKLDLYLCYSGKVRPEKRKNELYINQGNNAQGVPTFLEQGAQYGLADTGFSTQGYFFDFDRDHDLDLFLLNHNPDNLPVLDEARTAVVLAKEDAACGVRLFRNDNNHFTDITRQAGISSSALTYGLGAGIADLNGDGWPDIYVSNDYAVPDYLYINNGNGTFTDQLAQSIGHSSQFSMGNDIADVNNDGLPDIFTLDMLPEDNHRQKLLFAPDNYEKFDLNLRSGFHYQYMRNMLQLNNGTTPGTHLQSGNKRSISFRETAQQAGVSNTDWSWAPLLADYDNDGWKDLFVTNGYLRDFTNMDFIKYMNDYLQGKGRLQREDVLDLVHQIPSSNLTNYVFANNGDGNFTNKTQAWGITKSSNSNGAAYADLDNDGDLDLVINNINEPAFLYRNETNGTQHYLQVKLKGAGGNTQGLGARLTLYHQGQQQLLEQMPTRGYLSTVSTVLHAGLGKTNSIDSLRITWLGGQEQVLRQVKADQVVPLDEKDSRPATRQAPIPAPFFRETTSPVQQSYATNTINDFKRQPLLVNPQSFNTPCLVKGDVNGDGLEDIYAGASGGQAARLYLQQPGGRFTRSQQSAFDADKNHEDADAVFFDANGDGHIDLYVASGGYHHFLPDDGILQDRLYLNNGKGQFTKSNDALPLLHVSKSCVRVQDINGDGAADLFVGGRVVPGRYPETPESFLLINDGKGHFSNQVATIAPALQKAGMITDAAWIDMNGDKQPDLVIAGEWMPIQVFMAGNKQLQPATTQYFEKPYSGWWNKLLIADFNKDGRPDIIAGNNGLNTQCRVSDQEPATLYYKDFDDNGAIDPICCFYIQGKEYPYVTRDELLDQMSIMRTRFVDYKSYADATMETIFTKEELNGVNKLQANYLATAYFASGTDGKLHLQALPATVQSSPIYTITRLDYDKDGVEDLLLCGNVNRARLRFGKSDANFGVLLRGDGKGQFNYIPQQQSGFHLTGDVRSVLALDKLLLFGINQQSLKAYTTR
ncbi:VCBS repeat-containing protein [Paraflavitalea pollutisoli]|uniref:VCBS repeat-containing protein n=1 Tax=Paraflavitalea pollutisoli TaxID=3034143 RepID=UPI0023EB3773|nr:VCBS repeat-containing protein [Paraflavitalea sp. H1-2-19X]